MGMRDWSRYEIYFHLALVLLAAGMAFVISVALSFLGKVEITPMRYLAILALALILMLPLLLLRRKLFNGASNFFFPDASYDRPQPVYSRPAALRAQNRLDEAIAEYEAIIAEYPDLARAYVELMDLYDLDLHDREKAAEVYRRGCAAIPDGRERRLLDEQYREITRGA